MIDKKIDKITLDNVLPEVFRGEDIHTSDVWQCQLSLQCGDAYQIEAASGTGKSSLCAYLYGSRTDYVGSICFDGRDIRTFSINEWQQLRRTSIAYMPQELSLFPELTAIQNIELKNRLTGYFSIQRIEELMERLGIALRRDTLVARMSVGQQQRVALIRALCQPFRFILLDEPVSHLDSTNNHIAAEIVACEAARQGAGILSTSVGNPLVLDYNEILKL